MNAWAEKYEKHNRCTLILDLHKFQKCGIIGVAS